MTEQMQRVIRRCPGKGNAPGQSQGQEDDMANIACPYCGQPVDVATNADGRCPCCRADISWKLELVSTPPASHSRAGGSVSMLPEVKQCPPMQRPSLPSNRPSVVTGLWGLILSPVACTVLYLLLPSQIRSTELVVDIRDVYPRFVILCGILSIVPALLRLAGLNPFIVFAVAGMSLFSSHMVVRLFKTHITPAGIVQLLVTSIVTYYLVCEGGARWISAAVRQRAATSVGEHTNPVLDPAVNLRLLEQGLLVLRATYLAWREGRLDQVSDNYREYTEKCSFEEFRAIHPWMEYHLAAAIHCRPLDSGEIPVNCPEEVSTLLTTKTLYIFEDGSVEGKVLVIPVRRIQEYVLSGWWRLSARITLCSGEVIQNDHLAFWPTEAAIMTVRKCAQP